jgi:hypothetical protein
VELSEVLDRFPQVFSEAPSLRKLVKHRILIKDGFQPKQLKAYKISEQFIAKVSPQSSGLLRPGFIEQRNLPKTSPTVCILKKSAGSDGKRDTRIAIDYD